jgi:Na+/H+ antiporter NhaB
MKKLRLLLILTFTALLAAPAFAEIPTVDHIQPPEVLYLSIAGLFFMLALIVYIHTHPIRKTKSDIKIEYFLKGIIGGLSMTLAFLVSSWFGDGAVIWPVYQGLTYNIQSQALSYFFIAWGLLMSAYTFFGVLIMYFNEANNQIEKGFDNEYRTELR